MKNRIITLLSVAFISLSSTTAIAGLIPVVWNDWTQIAAEDQTGNFNYVNPGWGGQGFDAEYLYFKQNGKTVSFGIQTGFDVIDGYQVHGNQHYWAGELVLSFGSQEFAIDFGLDQCGYSSINSGTCGTELNAAAGVYGNVTWNNDIYFTQSGPFAMTTGDFLGAINSQVGSADVGGQKSYYRTVSFNLANLGPLDTNNFNIHWTMSCGNDLISGTGSLGYSPALKDVTDVPAPSNIMLLLVGLLGAALLRHRIVK